MKKTTLTIAAGVFIAGTILTGCSSPAEKVENAEANFTRANNVPDNANKEYLADMESYKKETADKIEANNESIAEFKLRIENEKKEAKKEYEKKIEILEQKNSDVKKKMDDYKADGKEQWEKFKTEFSRDMDELGKAFNDLTVKNVK